MSILDKLTEGITHRDLGKEGGALLSKWEKTGLLEGLGSDNAKTSMARLLENQAKELLRESSSMGAGDVEGFAAVAFPIVRRVFAGLVANDLVSVQPMSLPSGLIFFLDFTFGDRLGPDDLSSEDMSHRMGNLGGLGAGGVNAAESIYGTNKVASGIADGVNILTDLKADQGGPYVGNGYAYASPTGSVTTSTDVAKYSAFALNDGELTEAQKKAIEYDADLLTLSVASGSTTTHEIFIVTLPQAQLANCDFDNMGAISASTPDAGSGNRPPGGYIGALTGGVEQVRRLTRQDPDTPANVLLTYVGAAANIDIADVAGGFHTIAGSSGITIDFPLKDSYTTSGLAAGALKGSEFGLEDNVDIPEIDIKVDSIAVTAQTKKLKARWTPELGQDLNAYHNLDAEVELTSILSEQIALEIDREILADLLRGATAGTYYWARSPGLFVNRSTGAEIGHKSAAPDFTGTVSEWYETLVETINDVSAQIHRKTLRGGANFVVVSPEVANILEFTSGFRASITADEDRGTVGAVKAGSLSKKWDVYVDPYFPRNLVLVGRRGASFLESGYVYAPYVPLQVTPTIFGVEDFVPRKGVMTRYAKKMVRPDMYGVVVVRGLLGEAGATS